MFSELLDATRPTRQLAPADPQTSVEGGGTATYRKPCPFCDESVWNTHLPDHIVEAHAEV